MQGTRHMPRVGRSMMTVNVYFAESTGVVSATALGNEVQYFILVMDYMKSYQRFIIELLIAFFKNRGALLRNGLFSWRFFVC